MRRVERNIRSGDVFGRLTIMNVFDVPRPGGTGTYTKAKARCICGKVKNYYLHHLTREQDPTVSCGCYHSEQAVKTHTKHGMSRDQFYHVYHDMNQRCNNPRSQGWENYGGRGIRTCREWTGADGFANFVAWNDSLLPQNQWKHGLTLERRDNNRGYGPRNCYWATHKQQMHNQRKTLYRSFRGKVVPEIEIFETLKHEGRIRPDISYQTFSARINRYGQSLKDAASKPLGKSR